MELRHNLHMSEKTAATTVAIQRPLDIQAWVAVRVGQPAAARGAAAAELMQILHLDEDCIATAYLTPVSYTHLDVYKRQAGNWPYASNPRPPFRQRAPARW